MTLFRVHLNKSLLWNSDSKFCRVGFFGKISGGNFMVNVGCLNAVTTIQYKGIKAINAKIDKIIRETVLLENLLIFMEFIDSHPL